MLNFKQKIVFETKYIRINKLARMPSKAKCQGSQKNKGENMTYLPFMLMIQIRYSFMTNNIQLKINIRWNNYYLSFGLSLLSPKLQWRFHHIHSNPCARE